MKNLCEKVHLLFSAESNLFFGDVVGNLLRFVETLRVFVRSNSNSVLSI